MKFTIEQSVGMIVNLIIHSGLIGIIMSIFFNVHRF